MRWRGRQGKPPVSKVRLRGREHLILRSGPLKDGDSDSVWGGL